MSPRAPKAARPADAAGLTTEAARPADARPAAARPADAASIAVAAAPTPARPGPRPRASYAPPSVANADPLRDYPLRDVPPSDYPRAIEHLPIAALTPWAKNARTHSRKQIWQLADSIEVFGWTTPILVDRTGTILAGHGRVEAAKLLGMTSVPCIRIEHMSAAQKRAYVLADNKLALNAGWDEELLGEELSALMGLDDLDFDLGVTGFSIAEVDGLVDGLAPEEPGDPADDAVPEVAPRRVQVGDVWQLGPHRLACGDALDPEVVALLMHGPGGQEHDRARLVFTDPPYNVPIDGHVVTKTKSKGQAKTKGATAPKHREFAMASGEMTPEQFTAFLTQAFRNMAQHARDGSLHYVCMDWRHLREVLDAGEEVFAELKNLVVWAKDRGGMGSFYRSRHELVFVFKLGTAPHTNSFELGQHGRYRTNVWEYHVASTAAQGSPDDRSLHPTVKPVQMIADAIKDASARGEIVLDLFGGSGSTLIAAHKTGRRARLVELDPVYCDRILARWEAYAGDEAELVERRRDKNAGEPVPQGVSGAGGGGEPSPGRPVFRDPGSESRPAQTHMLEGRPAPGPQQASSRKSRARRSAAPPLPAAPSAPAARPHVEADTLTEESSR